MKQQEVKKELKLKAAKSGGKVTPVTGNDDFFLLNRDCSEKNETGSKL